MNTHKNNTIILERTQQVLATKIRYADNYFLRLRGLIGKTQLAESEVILISPCKQVHTHFMRYPIDVVFLDKYFTVISKVIAMQPWRVSSYVTDARYVLELSANAAAMLEPADKLIFQ
jgi:uncharacterized membrane protein (UPF0127 family)